VNLDVGVGLKNRGKWAPIPQLGDFHNSHKRLDI
jgi:hypothetical protein